jgi:hypothetical protein
LIQPIPDGKFFPQTTKAVHADKLIFDFVFANKLLVVEKFLLDMLLNPKLGK